MTKPEALAVLAVLQSLRKHGCYDVAFSLGDTKVTLTVAGPLQIDHKTQHCTAKYVYKNMHEFIHDHKLGEQ